MNVFYCKLRSNLLLEGDIKLAERELLHFFSKIESVKDGSCILNKLGLDEQQVMSNTRPYNPIGFLCFNNRFNINNIAKRTSFIQEIWFDVTDKEKIELVDVPWQCIRKFQTKRFICLVPLMCSAEILSYIAIDEDINSETVKRITDELAGIKHKKNSYIRRAIKRVNTSNPHVHGLHKYKAKFFPRMTRSLMVSVLDSVPKDKNNNVFLLDPFVGSGTALAEASLLEVHSKGIDIDKLSCQISNTKINILNSISVEELQQALEHLEFTVKSNLELSQKEHQYKFPSWIEAKFIRWNALEEQKEYELEITNLIASFRHIKNTEVREILEICLSDALSRKFNIRMMGTGVGRFALEIGKKSLSTIFFSNLKKVDRTLLICKLISKIYKVQATQSEVVCASATNLPIEDNSISLVFTSPPYLPASSGRENYLIGKSISITALSLLTLEEIEKAEIKSIGSMKVKGNIDFANLPNQVFDLYEWLKNDELRSIKAIPTYIYYVMLKKALQESYRVLMCGGLAVYIIGKESVFYKFSTREVLYRVKCDLIFKDIAISCGFVVEEKIDVQLDKKNRNARPRSLDSYYETVFLLRKQSNS